jgi:hypothetical protein
MTERRTFNTPLREPWNPIVYQCLRAVDCHNAQYFLTGNAWHLEQSELLRQYVRSLKDWIREEEKRWFRLWAKALGPKEGMNEKEADVIACVRTIVFISYMTTNLFICAGVLRHWHD